MVKSEHGKASRQNSVFDKPMLELKPKTLITTPRQLVLVTGLSGAGHTSCLHLLEDLGYEAVDNLPLSLVEVLAWAEVALERPLALGIDIRSRGFSVASFLELVDRLNNEAGIKNQMIFLDCDDAILLRRFTETRRRHPLAVDRPVSEGIRLERILIETLRTQATLLIDTSQLTLAELRQRLAGLTPNTPHSMTITLISFAYKHGLPGEADLVFDVRFLRNPYYDLTLRSLTGHHSEVATYIINDSSWESFKNHMYSLLDLLLPRYESEGKNYLMLAIGCTGGQHRSVFVAEQLMIWLHKTGRSVQIEHRDLRQPIPLS